MCGQEVPPPSSYQCECKCSWTRRAHWRVSLCPRSLCWTPSALQRRPTTRRASSTLSPAFSSSSCRLTSSPTDTLRRGRQRHTQEPKIRTLTNTNHVASVPTCPGKTGTSRNRWPVFHEYPGKPCVVLEHFNSPQLQNTVLYKWYTVLCVLL